MITQIHTIRTIGFSPFLSLLLMLCLSLSLPAQSGKDGKQSPCFGGEPLIYLEDTVGTCIGSTVTLKPTFFPDGGQSSWSDGSMTANITVGQGRYILTYTTNPGCVVMDTVDVIETTNSITGTIFTDNGYDGLYDPIPIDGPHAGVVVTLFNEARQPVDTTYTNALGNYAFSCRAPGHYWVGFENLPFGYVVTRPGVSSFIDQVTRLSQLPLHLTPSSNLPNQNGGLAPMWSSTIMGLVWHDLNADGIQDPGEPPLADVPVVLVIHPGGGSTMTDAQGQFTFSQLAAGTYYVSVPLPWEIEGTTGLSPADQGGSEYLDSDLDPITGFSPPILLPAGLGVDNLGIGFAQDLRPGVKPIALLEGPYNPVTGEMSTELLQSGVLPLTEPLSGLGYSLTAGLGATRLPSLTNVTDWVMVELRPAHDSTTTLAAIPALLLSDGQIVDTLGKSLRFDGVPIGSYWVVIRHRNSLDIMSAQAVELSSNPITLNFSHPGLPAFGPEPQLTLTDGQKGMIPGDANRDGNVQPSDKNNSWRLEVGLSGYLDSDFNLNGQSQPSDKNEKWSKQVGKSSRVP
jgi:hypothetical protein